VVKQATYLVQPGYVNGERTRRAEAEKENQGQIDSIKDASASRRASQRRCRRQFRSPQTTALTTRVKPGKGKRFSAEKAQGYQADGATLVKSKRAAALLGVPPDIRRTVDAVRPFDGRPRGDAHMCQSPADGGLAANYTTGVTRRG